jgi:hypothetical protein
MLGSIGVISAIMAIDEERKAFNAYLKTLPEDKAKELKLQREERLMREDEHRKALELANASRPRNFWGQ